jgi:hypothetical protein
MVEITLNNCSRLDEPIKLDRQKRIDWTSPADLEEIESWHGIDGSAWSASVR